MTISRHFKFSCLAGDRGCVPGEFYSKVEVITTTLIKQISIKGLAPRLTPRGRENILEATKPGLR